MTIEQAISEIIALRGTIEVKPFGAARCYLFISFQRRGRIERKGFADIVKSGDVPTTIISFWETARPR